MSMNEGASLWACRVCGAVFAGKNLRDLCEKEHEEIKKQNKQKLDDLLKGGSH